MATGACVLECVCACLSDGCCMSVWVRVWVRVWVLGDLGPGEIVCCWLIAAATDLLRMRSCNEW